ncbi:MAG: General stress protein 69 [candidate division WS2 bacterium]|uniref:General stress protein 69 n=1 Tax=Psychracetigena formicireducens TaxID=2986056 RepID=A0A9E2BIS8_PSYF1|nr:General stress protein 69 [Candidatus Psychracetigena formicireducens]
MQYNLFGNTGMYVSELCLGTMTIGGRGYWEAIGTLGASMATELLGTFYENGGDFIDSADGYGFGKSEEFVGEALKKLDIPREEWVIATKGMLRMGPGVNNVGLSKKHITEAINGSLKRLQVDYIDLYQIHGWIHSLQSKKLLVH